MVRHTKALAQTRQDGEDASSSDSATDGGRDDRGSDDVLTHDEPEHSHEVATKLPLWDLSFHLAALDKRAEAPGRRERGLQRIVLAACKPGAPRAAPRVKKVSYPSLFKASASLEVSAYSARPLCI